MTFQLREARRAAALRAAILASSLCASGCFWTDSDADDPDADTGDADDEADPQDGDDDDADDTGDVDVGLACDPSFALAGTLDGIDAADAAPSPDTTFYNRSLEEVVFGQVDFALMEELGLSAEDPEDRERFAYFSAGFELRNLYTEYLDDDYVAGLLPRIGSDVSIAFFDLAAHDVQPGTPVAVFDASPIEAVRNSGDRDALAAVIRELVDDMRTNGQPDVVVTFAPDRSDESLAEAIWIAMLSPNARFATAGTATYHSLVDLDGTSMTELAYPNQSIAAISIDVDASFSEDEPFTVAATCLPVTTSG